MSTVYVVFHADIEDDRYVRGVYATAALARAVVTMDEVWGEAGYRTRHYESCCGVDEWTVAEALPEVMHGPEQPVVGGPSLIPDSVYIELMQQIISKSPYRRIIEGVHR